MHYILNFFGHLHTINMHRLKVFILCTKAGIPLQGLLHDLSKYSPTEFFEGVKYYANGKYSPIINAKKDQGYSKAWLHHKGRNKHHWEYWVDFTRKGQVPAKMPYNYVLEMFCDRVAASKIYEGKNYTDAFPLQYYESGQYSYILHPETRALIRFMLVYLKDHGLDDTIKMLNRHHDYDEYFVEFKDDFM